MNHYFTDNTEMHHNRKDISFRFLDVSYFFVSDAGVFSRDKIDFGSELLIKTVIENNPVGENLLDLGCGYGVISIILKKILNKNTWAIDVNPRALELCKENANNNKVEINAYCGDGIFIDQTFDVIVTNPPIRAGKETIYRFFQEAYDHLLEKGTLWIVIRKQQGANSAINKLNEIFGNCEIKERKKGYYILLCQKLTTNK